MLDTVQFLNYLNVSDRNQTSEAASGHIVVFASCGLGAAISGLSAPDINILFIPPTDCSAADGWTASEAGVETKLSSGEET